MIRLPLLLASLLPAVGLAAPGKVGPVQLDDDLDEVYKARRVALVVGVDAYADPELQSLSFAGNDAIELGATLEDPAAGGYDDVVYLTGADATRAEDIRAAISEATADLQRNDTFLLYLSGHGTLTLDPLDGTQLWFLPSDARLSDPKATGIGVDWLEDTLHELTPRRRVLIMDTCHNGRSKSGLSADTAAQLARLKGDPPAPAGVSEVSESEARLFAAEFHQPAMEDPDLQHGVYTYFLIQALTSDRDEADLDRDGLVDVVEAHGFAQESTVQYTGGLQVPRYDLSIVGREKIYLSGDPAMRRSAENALLTAYDGLLASAKLLVNGTPRGSGVVALEPGRHTIEVQTQDGRTVVERKVNLKAGETRKVEDLLPRASRFSVLGGVQYFSGPGSNATVSLQPELEFGWRRVRRIVQPMAHLRLSGAYGGMSDGYETNAWGWAGQSSIGVGLGLGNERFVIGPQAEIGLQARYLLPTFDAPASDQSALLVAPGLRAQADLWQEGAVAMTLRYDVRVTPFSYEDAYTVLISQGLALGVTFR